MDHQLSGGHISPASFPYLIRPGDVLVSTAHGEVETKLATAWARPEDFARDPTTELYDRLLGRIFTNGNANELAESQASWQGRHVRLWNIEYWSLHFDGRFFSIPGEGTLELDWAESGGVIKIQDLSIYPLRHAEQSLRDSLANRGRTFWSCRRRRLVSYDDPESESWESVSRNLCGSREGFLCLQLSGSRTFHGGFRHVQENPPR